MDIFDSESLTPPGSPVLGYSGLRGSDAQKSSISASPGSVPVYCFSCKGPLRPQDKFFSPDGFFLRNEVISVIKRFSAQPAAVNNGVVPSVVKLFGHKFDPMERDQLKVLVRMCRKNIYTLEAMTHSSFSFEAGFLGSNVGRNDEIRANPFKIRSNVCSFLNYIAARPFQFNASEIQELFVGLKKALERPKSWSSSLQHHCGSKEGNECSSSEYHLFHLQLELRWSLLLIFELSQPVINWVMEDLLYLAYVKYLSSDRNLLETNPFNCYCVKELWAMIRAIVEQLKPEGKDFWDFVSQPMERIRVESDLIFPLWLFSNLATLNDYSINGLYSPVVPNIQRVKSENSESCYTLVHQVLHDWAQRGGKTFEVNELIFRLLPYWGFDLEVTLTLWNLWLPKIDKRFEASRVEPYSSAWKWLKLISTIVNLDHKTEPVIADKNGDYIFSSDPFLAFLRLLCAHVKICGLKDWRKLKSNICNRLPQKIVSTFDGNGLTRISTMFLALAFVTSDSESMCERLNEALSYGKDSLAITKLRARCVMILIFLKKGINVSSISSHIMKTVNEIMGMSVSGRTSFHKDLVMVYLDFLENIPKVNGDLNLGRSDLVSPNLTMWLSTCGPNYVNRTIRVLHNIMDTWILDSGGLPSLDKELVGQIIQDKTEQFLKQTVISSQNRNPEFDVQPLADLAVDLTILQSSKRNSVSVGSLYEIFALNPNTSPLVSEIYVERVVNSALVINMSSLLNQNKLTQSWIRLMTLGCAVPEKLTVSVFCEPFELVTEDSSQHETLLRRFCSIASEPGSFWTRSILQTSISPAIDALKAARNKSFGSNGTIVEVIVKSVGILFQNLPFCNIYVRNSQTSFVHQVLEVCCPNFVGKPPWEKLPDTFLAALHKYLPDIFVTISLHDQWWQDPYLKRKMCDIHRIVLLGFTKGEDLDDANPGLRIMQHCEYLNSNRDLLMQEIANSIYTLDKEDQIAKRFLLIFIGFANRRMITTISYLLGSVLDLLIEKVELFHRCRAIVSLTWASVLGRETYSHLIPILILALQTSMKKHFAFRSDRFFELFSTLASNTQQRIPIRTFLRTTVLPILTDHIVLSEARQGSGTNFKLRGLLKKLAKELES